MNNTAYAEPLKTLPFYTLGLFIKRIPTYFIVIYFLKIEKLPAIKFLGAVSFLNYIIDIRRYWKAICTTLSASSGFEGMGSLHHPHPQKIRCKFKCLVRNCSYFYQIFASTFSLLYGGGGGASSFEPRIIRVCFSSVSFYIHIGLVFLLI